MSTSAACACGKPPALPAARSGRSSSAMKKFLYLVRHGEADWPGWDQPDDERPLTKRGRSEVKKVAKFLRRMGAEPLLIFTSPLPRAKQTAQILAEQLCLELGVEEIGRASCRERV